jgi:hypothetical protein
MLALAQELWGDDPRTVQHTYGQIAWWAANIPHRETVSRLWFDDDRILGWGWVTGGTELEFQVRPTHRNLLDEILAWSRPDELMVRSDDEDAIRRIEAHGLVHDPAAPWMRRNSRSLDALLAAVVPAGYHVRTARDEDFA